MKNNHEITRKLWNNGRWASSASSRLVPTVVRRALLRQMCSEIGAVRVCAGFRLNNGNLVIADNSFINDDVVIDCNAMVTIESGVAVGPGCRFVTTSHLIGPPEMRRKDVTFEPIVVGAGSWLATNVTVLPGVPIGAGCIIGAGSVVHSDCAPNGFYAGVPARRVRDLPT